MKITLTLPDELYDSLKKNVGDDGRKVPNLIRECLERYGNLSPATRPIILGVEHRLALEEILESTINSPEAVVDLCQRLATIDMGEVECPFSIDELEIMKQQAAFMGETMEQYLTRQVEDFRRWIVGLP